MCCWRVTELGLGFRSDGLLQNCLLQVREARQWWVLSGHTVGGRSPSDKDIIFLTYFFFTKSQTKASLGKVAKPAAARSLQIPCPRPTPKPCWPHETCKAGLQVPCYGRGRERQRCPPGGQSHDLGLFLANHWLSSQRPSRQKAQASTRPACHFLTLSEDPRTRSTGRGGNRGGCCFQQRGV